jgi:hypothetical protein
MPSKPIVNLSFRTFVGMPRNKGSEKDSKVSTNNLYASSKIEIENTLLYFLAFY